MQTGSSVSDNSNKLSQFDKFKQAARDLEADDDPERFKGRLRRAVKHKPVERTEQ